MDRPKIQLNYHELKCKHINRKKALESAGVKVWTPEDLKVEKTIGAGSFGRADLVTFKLKRESKGVMKTNQKDDDEIYVKTLIKELNVLCALNHPNIVSILGAVAEPLAIVMEYVAFDLQPYGINKVVTNLSELLKLLHECDAVGLFQEEYDIIRVIANNTAQGLAFLHDSNIAHRDLKPSNILVGNTKNGVLDDNIVIECKITDFGEARSCNIQTNSILASRTANVDRGTIPFQAPEAILGYLKSANMSELKMVDVWAYGCVLYCLLNPDFQFPFQKEFEHDPDTSKDFRRCVTSFLNDRRLPQHSMAYTSLRKQVQDTEKIMTRCLVFVPSKRPTFIVILERFSCGNHLGDTARNEESVTTGCSLAVVVTNIPQAIEREYLKWWFESDPRSGGGTIEEFYADELISANSVTITFKSAKVAERVASIPQWPKEMHLPVKPLAAAIIMPDVHGCIDDKKVFVTNITFGSTLTDLKAFLEKHATSPIEGVILGQSMSTALVTFQCPIEFSRMRELTRVRPFRGNMLGLQKVCKSTAVKVEGVKRLDDLLIQLYFESQRSGGGKIVQYQRNSDQDCVFIHYEDHEVVVRILERSHNINQQKLIVSEFHDCLGVMPNQTHPINLDDNSDKKIIDTNQSVTLMKLAESFQRKLQVTATNDAASLTMKSVVDSNSKKTIDKLQSKTLTHVAESFNSKHITETIDLDYRLSKYIQQFRKADLDRISRLCDVKIKSVEQENGHGLLIRGSKKDVDKCVMEVLLIATELNDIIHKETIDITKLQCTGRKLSDTIRGMQRKYEYVVFDCNAEIIQIIGDQQHINQAKRELLEKLVHTGHKNLPGPMLQTHPKSQNVDESSLNQGTWSFNDVDLDFTQEPEYDFDSYGTREDSNLSFAPVKNLNQREQSSSGRSPALSILQQLDLYTLRDDSHPDANYKTRSASRLNEHFIPNTTPSVENYHGETDNIHQFLPYPHSQYKAHTTDPNHGLYSDSDFGAYGDSLFNQLSTARPTRSSGQPHGTMTTNHMDLQLTGCWNKGGTFEISFHFPAGNQQGIRYGSKHHKAYVQDTTAGKRVVKLLKQAFEARVLFVIGAGGQITWNGVHLITNKGQAAWRGYLPSVIEQLAALGIY